MREKLSGGSRRGRGRSRLAVATLSALLLPFLATVQDAAAAGTRRPPASPSAAGATKLVAVRSEKVSQGQSVRLEADGRLQGTVDRKAGPLRLVVTLPGVRNAVGSMGVSARGPFVRRIGLARTSGTEKSGTRVTLYLDSPAAHEVRRDASGLSIVLTAEAAGQPAGAAAAGQSRSVSEAATGPRITLSEAIRRTLEASPEILLARQTLRSQRGFLQQAAGEFDTTVVFQPLFRRGLSAVMAGAQKTPSSGTTSFRITGGLLDNLGRELEQDRDPFAAGGAVRQLRANPSFPRESTPDLLKGQVLGMQTSLLPGFGPSSVDLSGYPSAEKLDTFTMDLELPFHFRNGMVVSPLLQTQAVQDRSVTGVPTEFQATAGLRLDWPLAKGGGAASADANERAARLEVEAALQTVASTASRSVLQTVLSYWALAAAEERLALVERSTQQQQQIEKFSQALVTADEIPRSELDRIRARSADAEAAAAQARQALVSARIDLARAIGSTVVDLGDAPLARDPLPDPPTTSELGKVSPGELSALASSRRADVKAAMRHRDAADVLLTASRINLRPRIDFSVQAGYSGLYEDAALDATSGTGCWRSITGRWAGPNVALGLRFELPFGNDTYRGQFVQAGSVREQAEISAKDLERTAVIQVLGLSLSVRRAEAEASARQEAAMESDRMVATSFEQFRGGELSLIDAILTERGQTQAALDYVTARQALASSVAELRFEMGSLVPYSAKEQDVTFGVPVPIGLSFANWR
jgi:outer membrane protein TolC